MSTLTFYEYFFFLQMRDIPGFVVSRNTIATGKPQVRNSWVTAAVANYLGEQYEVALEMIIKCRIKATDKGDEYEDSELYLFENRCLEKMQRYQKAIDHLHANREHIVDKLAMNTKLAELNVLAGNFAVGKELWLTLVKQQPDNYRYHCGMQTAYLELNADTSSEMFALKRLELPSTTLELDATQLATLRNLYATTLNGAKKGASAKVALTLYCRQGSSSDEIRTALAEHIQSNLRHAVPALYHDIFSLVRMADPANPTRRVFAQEPADVAQNDVAKTALALVESYITNLRQCEQFDAANPAAKPEPPTALLWALYLRTHILEMMGQLPQALQCIEEAVAHTPTALDMIGKRARLLKKLGDYSAAAVCMDDCRVLDLQDRYLNNKATKYFLRADEVPLAMNTIALFTKHEGDPQQNLYELQCSWYELELAESYARSRQWGLALRKFYAIRKHFGDYNTDIFDFHGYCMRKVGGFVFCLFLKL